MSSEPIGFSSLRVKRHMDAGANYVAPLTVGPQAIAEAAPYGYPQTITSTSVFPEFNPNVQNPAVTIYRAENGFFIRYQNRTLVFETYASMTKFLENNIKPEGDK